MNAKNLREKRARAYDVMKDLQQRAKSEDRVMSADERQQWDEANKEFDTLTDELRRLEKWDAINSNLDAEDAGESILKVTDQRSNPEKYREAFWRMMRFGGTDITPEQRQLLKEFRGTNTITTTTSQNSYGGYTVPVDFSNELERTMKAFGGMLQAGRIVNTQTGGQLDWPTLDDTSTTASWYADTTGRSLTVQDLTFSRKQFNAYTLATIALMSLEFIQDESVDLVSGELRDIFAERLGRSLNKALTDGNGSGKPTGILDSSNGASTGKTTASATAITAVEVLDLVHSVDPAYRTGPNVAFMLNDSTLSALKQLTVGSSDDRPLWVPSMRENEPDRIWGFRYVINQDFPSIASTNDTIAFGDWSKYIIRQVALPQMMVLQERYMDQLARGFVMWARYDGKLLNTSAIKLLTQKTA